MSKATNFIILILVLTSLIPVNYSLAYNISSDPRLLFWLVPWGPSNGTYENLLPYLQNLVVGIVFPFNTYNLGNENVSLQQALNYGNNEYWISEQLSKLDMLYNSSNLLFINFFLTTDNWRGYLTNVTHAQMLLLNYTLHKIANVTNGGEKLAVGVSEMNDLSNYGYYEVYSLIKQILPNAKLFYYTDLGQSVSSVESVFEYLQSNGITLNYIGYDVYPYPSYSYVNGIISIPNNYVNQILDLENFANQQGVSFFIGEIGFRDGDIKGYINPASTTYIDFNSTIGYQDTINYYEDVISQLNSMAINLIGIWNYNGWNGDPFGLWDNPYFNQLLEFVGIHPVKIAKIDVVSTFPYYYINGTIYNVNRTYVVILPANITLINEKYINSTSRLILTNVTINGNSTSRSFVINQQGEYTIMANYVIQYYVTTNVNVSAYVNGIKEELSSGWYNRGSIIQVFPQIIPISQYEIYNITRTFNFIVDYPMPIKIPYIVEYYVNVNFTGPPILAIINGTNRTLVSGYYPAGTIIEIPMYEYLNPYARLEIFSLPQKFIVNASLQVDIKAISQFLVLINLPNGSISGWYNNGSVIVIPKVIKVNGTTYILNGSDEIEITHPLFITPEYIKLVNNTETTTETTTNIITNSQPSTTLNSNTITLNSSSSTMLNSSITITQTLISHNTLNTTALILIIILTITAIIVVIIIAIRRQ
ncbi:hypothetical protein YN1551_2011 [Sulfolobus islandicus Y.N.15.51]|uniref:Uncharacterized protein n=1 Tax=Saccharolobus islandicus (strain Y.N.15.51 / Yellowstone \|nr:hypothetical protein [Sulfolobus islandicus]ACP49047.1 hypothetical protein YN1551_2011 [Sulfolobus islandicus Y.N.15.51]